MYAPLTFELLRIEHRRLERQSQSAWMLHRDRTAARHARGRRVAGSFHLRPRPAGSVSC